MVALDPVPLLHEPPGCPSSDEAQAHHAHVCEPEVRGTAVQGDDRTPAPPLLAVLPTSIDGILATHCKSSTFLS